MAVYYRYRSGVDTFSVPVPAPSISVADMKRLILGTARHGHGRTRGRGPRETVALSDARTGEELADDGAQVSRGSTVVVRRLAAGPPAETITVAPPSPKAAAARDGASSSAQQDDDEGRAISAVIDAAQLKWEDRRHPSQGGGRCCYGRGGGAQEQRTPPPGYVCHRCHVPGHFIQHCPTNGDPRFDLGTASSTTTTTSLTAPAPVSSIPDDGVPPELHCMICKKVMADAVVTGRCCFDSFCDACIRGRIVAESKCVCGGQACADDLVPNHTLRVTIANMLAARAAAGASGGTDNQKSSVGSNAASTTQRPAASQNSGSHVVLTAAGSEHSDDGSASSVACEPRTKQTTAESAQTMARAGYPEQYGCGVPFGPACYDPFFGGMHWASDPYMYYGVPFAGGYPIVPVPAGYQDGCHGRKRTANGEGRRLEEPGFKRCRNRSLVAV